MKLLLLLAGIGLVVSWRHEQPKKIQNHVAGHDNLRDIMSHFVNNFLLNSVKHENAAVGGPDDALRVKHFCSWCADADDAVKYSQQVKMYSKIQLHTMKSNKQF